MRPRSAKLMGAFGFEGVDNRPPDYGKPGLYTAQKPSLDRGIARSGFAHAARGGGAWWPRSRSLVSAGESALEGEEGGDFLAVVVQVLDAQIVRPDAGEPLADQLAALLDRVDAALHRQLEVEDRVPAVPGADPLGHQRGDPRRLLHHVAHHPV